MSEIPNTEFGRHKKPISLFRIWKILTAIATLIALAVTVAFIWYVTTQKTEKSGGQHAGQHVPDLGIQSAAIMACP